MIFSIAWSHCNCRGNKQQGARHRPCETLGIPRRDGTVPDRRPGLSIPYRQRLWLQETLLTARIMEGHLAAVWATQEQQQVYTVYTLYTIYLPVPAWQRLRDYRSLGTPCAPPCGDPSELPVWQGVLEGTIWVDSRLVVAASAAGARYRRFSSSCGSCGHHCHHGHHPCGGSGIATGAKGAQRGHRHRWRALPWFRRAAGYMAPGGRRNPGA